ncbi:hypothetical protein MFU01_36730 [Myxococcus fulvus]|uniref:Uncharacterized protein n=1 Tax=Myxococcus fulvus TaxID=33 RepID=A0A511T395_MYXFU|nr:hypothetical protein MFU01_36730 [Myxococcus fulvus]
MPLGTVKPEGSDMRSKPRGPGVVLAEAGVTAPEAGAFGCGGVAGEVVRSNVDKTLASGSGHMRWTPKGTRGA